MDVTARRMLLLVFLLCAGSAASAADPRNVDECMQMTRAPLEARCATLFAGAGQEGERRACLGAVGPQLEAVCRQFFGQGQDFCAACTSACTDSFASGDGKRRECLAMCMRQPGCQ